MAFGGVGGSFGNNPSRGSSGFTRTRELSPMEKRRAGIVDAPQLAQQTSAAISRTNAATKERETESRGLLDQIIGLYRQGGGFGKGVESSLERERTQTLATGGQSLVSSGMYNTTQLAGLSTQFAENVAAPTRLKLEDMRMDRLAGALGQKSSFVEGISNEQPDYRLLAQLLQGM